MIKYNNSNINDWYFYTSDIVKVYRNNAVCYYKITGGGDTPTAQTPCFAVVDDISQYQDTEFVDVFNKADSKWYKLNNLNQYEQYGVYGSGRTITYYEGKLTIDGDYEYQYSGSSWVNVGEISGDTPYDYSQYYLTLQALESGTIGFSNGTVDYSTDSGSTWSTLAQGNTISVSQGDEVLFKMSGATPNSNTGIGTFTSSGRFNIYGNIMSLQDGDNFTSSTTIANAEFQFKKLFAESKVVSAENMVLPATTLKNFCYNELFRGSAYLVTPPKIFPATALTQDCYSSSFRECPSLTKSPILPAPTSARASYGWMFQDSTSLSEVTCLATNVSAQYATYDWLKNVASSGTFYKNPNASWSRGTSAIPSNWNVEDYVEPSPLVYPVYYDEMQDPPNNLVFSTMAEAEEYECPWVGMTATIDGVKYVFSGDSQTGYEWVLKPSRLPAGYTEVEYIQNTGHSYIDTNFVPNQDTRIVADMQLVTQTDYPRLFGAGAWNSATGINIDYEGGYLLISWFGKTSWTKTTLATNLNRHVYDLNKNYLYIDETLLTSNTYTTKTASDNLAFFTYIANGRPSTVNDWNKEFFRGKLWSFKVYDNGTLVRDFVPCIRDNDSKVGAYDIVNDVFYTVPTGYTTDKLIAGNPV